MELKGKNLVSKDSQVLCLAYSGRGVSITQQGLKWIDN